REELEWELAGAAFGGTRSVVEAVREFARQHALGDVVLVVPRVGVARRERFAVRSWSPFRLALHCFAASRLRRRLLPVVELQSRELRLRLIEARRPASLRVRVLAERLREMRECPNPLACEARGSAESKRPLRLHRLSFAAARAMLSSCE